MRLAVEALARHCAERPREIAIVDADGAEVSWLELAARTASVRALVCKRSPQDARVAITVPSGWPF